jgi:hypothetical protein
VYRKTPHTRYIWWVSFSKLLCQPGKFIKINFHDLKGNDFLARSSYNQVNVIETKKVKSFAVQLWG